jgi:hypothetical protein
MHHATRSRARLFVISVLITSAVWASGCSAFDPHLGARNEADNDDAYTTDGASDSATVSFARDIRPLMDRDNGADHPHGCKFCHYTATGAGAVQSGLRLETLGQLRNSPALHGPIVKAGDPAGSPLVQKLHGTFAVGLRMPRDGSPDHYWTDAEIALVETWIAQGAQGADTE